MRVSVQDVFGERLGSVEQTVARIATDALDVADEDTGPMRGLTGEVDRIVRGGGPSDARDRALIAAAQRIEQLELAFYRTARALG
jgi:ferritin-like metal-binding protein YciE